MKYLKKRRTLLFLLKTIFLSLTIVGSFYLTSCSKNDNYIHIKHIIDGDTFEDKNKLRYRLLGVDTPESFDSSNNFKQTPGIQKFYATKATNLSSKTIHNKTVLIKKWKLDTYKRIVVRIMYKDTEISKLLLFNGLARVKYISPIKGNFFYYYDVDYYNELIELETNAKIGKIGIWSLSPQEQKIVFPK